MKTKKRWKTWREIADAFLIGERPIARRVDDSVVRDGCSAPRLCAARAAMPPELWRLCRSRKPFSPSGPDLKNTITLVVNGQAFVSQHIGDLSHYDALRAFRETIQDLISMYEVSWDDLLACTIAIHNTSSTFARAGTSRDALPYSITGHTWRQCWRSVSSGRRKLPSCELRRHRLWR